MNPTGLKLSRSILVAAAMAGLVGCRSTASVAPKEPLAYHEIPPVGAMTQPASTQPRLMAGEPIKAVDAMVVPPIGWAEDPRRIDAKRAHLVWKSPSGDTAYGVVLMNLPLPVGPDMVLAGFLNHLRASDHEAELLSKEPAEDLHGYRFVAESGQYIIRVALSVHGWRAWAVYAGSLKAKPINYAELELAEEARDRTQVNLPAESAFAE